MKKLIIFSLLMLALIPALSLSQDYSRNWSTIYSHPTGRSGGPSFDQADSISVMKPYNLGVTFTMSVDTTLTTARFYVSVNGDSTRRYEVRGTSLGGESYTNPSPVYVRYFKLWGNAANLPIRFWVH